MRDMERIRRRIVRGACRRSGFTLIELLVVIIIIAILAAIAIPTYLGQRVQAADSSCFSLVRNALTAVQTVLVETGNYASITADALNEIETSITFFQSDEDLVRTNPPWINEGVDVDAARDEVLFYPESNTVMDIVSMSASGNWFGIQVDTVDVTESGYVKVRIIDGEADLGW